MINIVPILLAWYPIHHDIEALANLNKCSISWKVIQVEASKEYINNCRFADLIIKWEEGAYKLAAYNPDRNRTGTCFWTYWSNLNLLPKVWDNIDFLIDGDSYKVISWDKVSIWEYKFSSFYNTTENFEICEPNLWEDTEIQKETRRLHSQLNKLAYYKPKVITKLKTTLESIDLSKYNEKTRILTEFVKKIIDKLVK
jgi:hypothetical protein